MDKSGVNKSNANKLLVLLLHKVNKNVGYCIRLALCCLSLKQLIIHYIKDALRLKCENYYISKKVSFCEAFTVENNFNKLQDEILQNVSCFC